MKGYFSLFIAIFFLTQTTLTMAELHCVETDVVSEHCADMGMQEVQKNAHQISQGDKTYKNCKLKCSLMVFHGVLPLSSEQLKMPPVTVSFSEFPAKSISIKPGPPYRPPKTLQI